MAETKEQSLVQFHNAVGLAITEHLCSGNITPKDILDILSTELWSRKEIADVVRESLEIQAAD